MEKGSSWLNRTPGPRGHQKYNMSKSEILKKTKEIT